MAGDVPHPVPANGNGKIVWWLIGLLTTGAVGVSTSTLHTVQDNTSRIAVVESRFQETQRRLQRIEEKLDHLITREHPRSTDHGHNRPD